MLTLHDQLKRQVLLWILWITAIGSFVVALLHLFLEPDPLLVSLIIPPSAVVICSLLAITLHRHPDRLPQVTVLSLCFFAVALVCPVTVVIIKALTEPNVDLVEHLPPITSLLFLFTTILMIFVQPRRVVTMAMVVWAITALPILLYLGFHADELSSARGLDLAVSLGPTMMANLVLITFYGRLQSALDALEQERFHLKKLAERDGLTGLYNRATGERFLGFSLEKEHDLGLILFDIDRFKSINDTYGHPVGDQVLQETVQRCTMHLRENDIFVRWGGEEFLVVVEGIHESSLHRLAERLREAIAHAPMERIGTVTASFGVTMRTLDDNVSELVQRADQALYAAKHSGRNRVVVDFTLQRGDPVAKTSLV